MQTSTRSSRYRWVLGRGVEWSGIGRGASHPHANPRRDLMHTVERQREQLAMAGIADFPMPELGWLDGDVSGLGLPPRFALLVPGASPARPGKRWPARHFATFAAGLDLPVAVVGGPAEAPLAAEILAAAPGGVDLTGRTGYAALGAVARRAEFALGNDTGPTHLIAATGCPTLALFGPESDPALCAPRGRAVAVLQRDSLAGLTVAEARTALAALVAA
ncbi:glycosyltransferase family 9 protein [Dankookia sp. P2]|uniref:glycosyltransferase family 9 protein n=1 Tax=Dankookia sp. P2 TaxID=3423955 RepID=UPI003D673E65